MPSGGFQMYLMKKGLQYILNGTKSIVCFNDFHSILWREILHVLKLLFQEFVNVNIYQTAECELRMRISLLL